MIVRTSLLLAAFMAAFFMPSPSHAASCKASYYSTGQLTAQGKRFNPNGISAAHKTLPFGTKVRVTYAGRSVDVVINDRGPYIKGRCLDLSLGAARVIGLTGPGVAIVQYEVL